MNRFVYNIVTLQIVGMVNSYSTLEDEVYRNVIPNFGGKLEDYAVIETTIDHIVLVRENGKIVAKDRVMPEPEPPPPSETEIMMDYIVDVDYRVTLIELGLE